MGSKGKGVDQCEKKYFFHVKARPVTFLITQEIDTHLAAPGWV
jgi:hypothetical protein